MRSERGLSEVWGLQEQEFLQDQLRKVELLSDWPAFSDVYTLQNTLRLNVYFQVVWGKAKHQQICLVFQSIVEREKYKK